MTMPLALINRRRRGGGVVIPYVWRVRASDWNGAQLSDGNITFTGANPPTVSGDALGFDGVNDLLTATVNTDLVGKTLIWVATPGTTDATTDAIISMTGAGSLTYNVEAQSVGSFFSRWRNANFGAGSTLVLPSDPRNATKNRSNTRYLGLIRHISNEVTVVNGPDAAAVTTLTAGAKTVTAVRLGANTSTSYCPVSIFEVALIDSTDDAVIQAAISRMEAAYSVTGPIMTPFLERAARVFGDSIAVGVAADTYGFIEQTGNSLICATNDLTALAGAQMSPVTIDPGETARIAACFSRASTVAASYTGMKIVYVHFGVNDFRTDVPLGVITDTTEDTFYGAMYVGFEAIKSNAPTLPVMVTLPFYADDEDVENAEGLTLQDYRDAIEAVCIARGISYLNMGTLWNAGTSASYLTDGLHPNEAGHTMGALALLARVRAGVNVPA